MILIAFVDQLMCAGNKLEVVDVIKLIIPCQPHTSELGPEEKSMRAYLARNLVAEKPSGSSRRNGPRIDVFRVTPHEIAESTLMRNLLRSGHDSDLIQRPDLR